MLEPYEGTEDKGVLYYDQEKINEFCKKANREGMQIEIHAIGDAALQQATRGLKAALDDFPRQDHRHTIIHACLSTEEGIQICAKYGIPCSFIKAEANGFAPFVSVSIFLFRISTSEMILSAQKRRKEDEKSALATVWCKGGSLFIRGRKRENAFFKSWLSRHFWGQKEKTRLNNFFNNFFVIFVFFRTGNKVKQYHLRIS